MAMKSLRNLITWVLSALILVGSLTSCATVFGGKVTESQKGRPAQGEPRREIRVGVLIADILLFPIVSLPVDFATGAIYKPKAVSGQAIEKTSGASAKKTKK